MLKFSKGNSHYVFSLTKFRYAVNLGGGVGWRGAKGGEMGDICNSVNNKKCILHKIMQCFKKQLLRVWGIHFRKLSVSE